MPFRWTFILILPKASVTLRFSNAPHMLIETPEKREEAVQEGRAAAPLKLMLQRWQWDEAIIMLSRGFITMTKMGTNTQLS